MEEAYLKPRQEYVDRYDRYTVEQCRSLEGAITIDHIKKHSKEKHSESEMLRLVTAFNEMHLYFYAGERYVNKDTTIDAWMEADRKKDLLLEEVQAPREIYCNTCGKELDICSKQLETYLDKPDQVLFMFECPSGHLPRQAYYGNGERWHYEPPRCEKCATPCTQHEEDTDQLWKTVITCPSCGHVKVVEISRTNNEVVEDPNYEKDRARFCSEESGRKYARWMEDAKHVSVYMGKQREKEKNKELYDKIATIQKLTIPAVKSEISKVIESTTFTNLNFQEPEFARLVSLGFTIEDPTDRKTYDSVQDLKKLIVTALSKTNWRLMSDGISYRLGVLSGRIRVYENEEDLLKLVLASSR